MIQWVAKQVQTDPASWAKYGERDVTRREHAQELRTYLQLSPFGLSDFCSLVHELTELARSQSGARKVVRAGAVQRLVALLTRQNESLLEPSCACLSHLAKDGEGRGIIVSSGAARPLVLALRSTRSAVLREATGVLWNMTHKSEQGVAAICAARAIPSLVQQLGSADEHVLINVLNTLANVATTASGRAKVGGPQVGAVAAACKVLRTGGAGSRTAAAKLMAHLTHGPKSGANTAASQLVAARGVAALVSLLSAGGDAREHAAAALGNLARDAKYKNQIGDALGVGGPGGGGRGKSAVARAAASPRSRTVVESGPRWAPRKPPSRRQRLGLEPRRATAAAQEPAIPAAQRRRSGGTRDMSLSQSVTRLGAWKELCRQETIPQEQLQGHAARCRVGERVATRQPRPWSMYMGDTSGSWGHVTTEIRDGDDTL